MKKRIHKLSRIKLVLIVSILIATSFNKSGSCFSQGWQWAKSQGGLNNDAGRAICTDPSGNVIVAGGFFAPSIQIGTVTINSLGGGDIYLAKFDPIGNVIWVQTIGGTGLDVVGGVCTSTNGDIYISGSYDSPNLTVSSYNLSQASTIGNMDIFVAKYNTNGAVLWALKYGTTGNERATGINYSNSLGNVLLTGYYSSPTFTIGAYPMTNSSASGSNDCFVAKFNPTFGTPTGAFSLGGANANDYGYSIRSDASNFYLGGSFSPITGNVSSIGTAVTSYGSQDVFIAKYTNANAFQWVRTGGSSSTSADYFTGMAIDASSNIYLSGNYYGLPLVIGTATLANSGTNDGFIAKYNSSGTFQWANKVGGPASDLANDVAVDANNNAYLTGSFAGTLVTVGSFSLVNTTPGTNQDIFVVKYNSTGTPQWVSSATSIGGETAYGIATDALANVYITGSYNISGPIAFGSTTLSSAGNNDSFLAKIGCLTATINGLSNVCAGTSATLTAGGATNYTWSTGATTPSIVITPTANSTYTVVGAIGTCTDSSNPFNITFLPAIINAGPNISLTCGQSQIINATTSPSNPTSVAWTPTTGLSSSTILSPTILASGPSNQYTVTANLSNGCVAKTTLIVSHYAPTPDICMVTVDSLSLNNEIFWDKTAYSKIDSFIVYRETSSNIFSRIAAVGKTALSMYTDTARSVGPANGDPNITSYKYKLQFRDSCGNYSALSPWHQTIFVQDQQNGNFNWNSYAIENSTLTPVSNYVLNRRNLSSGNSTTVSATTGSSISDPLYSSLFSTNIKWFVDALGFNCTPTAKMNSILITKQRTKSNNTNEKTFPTIGIKKNSLNNESISIYPNPTNGVLNIDFIISKVPNCKLDLINVLGQSVYTENIKESNSFIKTINTENIVSGIYFLNISQNATIIITKKVIIN
ncbi:MAG: T9SS type A sorting domain-containing protein [Bacteroidota bacterium]|nr:T9SS type A sorting domain-containing protein [Bacteroidota bacterium]MDP3144926.1 T9SS type A sorting domain-containing protein [Bacteroidota bacterium]MDP3557061.1 T9SS type A sorting domain-containing protein [Bacteroidota bacterium]